MAGFFKKLFNRIVGKNEEQAPVVEQAVLPAPEPLVEVLVEAEVAAEAVRETKVPEASRVTTAKVLEKQGARPDDNVLVKVVAKKAEPKKVEAKTAVAKKVEAKKPDVQKPTAGKIISKPKSVTPATPESKKTKAKKPDLKKPDIKKTESKQKSVTPAKAGVQAKMRASPESLGSRLRGNDGDKSGAKAKKAVVEVVRTFEQPRLPEPEIRRATPPTPERPPPPPRQIVVAPPEPERKGWFSRLKDGLSKSSKSITGSITAIFTKRKLDATTLQELEDTLIQADLGITVAERIIKAVATGRYDKEIDPEEVKQILSDEVAKVLKPVEMPFNFGAEKPFVILVVGVNGSGKTTTIGKLGAIAAGEGFKVKFAACDTFRAAAIEQLTVWGQRVGADTISRPTGADAAGLAFDAMKLSVEDGTDILFIDTAGRLHNKTYLMDELDKVVRVIKKQDAAAPHAVLLVLDATTGQNALAQAEAFTKVAGVTGLIMTKLDGTARGGILVAIAEKFKLPIHAIGVGETIEDLQPFDADAFSRAIAGLGET